MGKLVIYRDSDEYANRFRNITLNVDENLYELKKGEKLIIELEEGKHSVNAKLDWGTSKTQILNFKENEIITIKLTSIFGSKKIVIFKLFVFIFSFVLINMLPYLNSFFKIILYIITGFMIIDLIRILVYCTILSDRILILKKIT